MEACLVYDTGIVHPSAEYISIFGYARACIQGDCVFFVCFYRQRSYGPSVAVAIRYRFRNVHHLPPAPAPYVKPVDFRK